MSPVYEYECPKCNHKFEELREMRDKDTATCPKCGGKVEQQISTFNFTLRQWKS